MADTSRFTTIDGELAKRLVGRFGSPFYLLDESGIYNRLQEMQHHASNAYSKSKVAISYKTNPTRRLLCDLHKTGALAEVVSGDEYQIALSLGVPTSQIVFNGPAKSNGDLEMAIRGESYIHCDHDDELDRVEAIAKQLDVKTKIGIRLYFPNEDNWHRFGFHASANDPTCHAVKTIERIMASDSLSLAGLHAQIGTNVRVIERFADFAKTFCGFIDYVVQRFDAPLEWIDVGGGLAGIAPLVSESRFQPHPLPSISDYCKSLITPFLPSFETLRLRSGRSPMLFLEPGRTLYNAFGGMLVTVIGRRPAGPDGIESVILNAGITSIHFAHKYNLPVHVCRNAENPDHSEPLRQIRLLGPTCMEQDVVCRPMMLPDLKPGDHLIIYATGCYSMSMGNSFIRFRPGTVGWDNNNQFRQLRKPESLEHSCRLDVMPKLAESSPTQIPMMQKAI